MTTNEHKKRREDFNFIPNQIYVPHKLDTIRGIKSSSTKASRNYKAHHPVEEQQEKQSSEDHYTLGQNWKQPIS